MALSEAFLTWEQEKETQSKQEERQTIALNMLKDNLPLEQIVRLTGLTIAQVQALQAQAEDDR
jgi:predicted transposase YdaD